MNMLPYDDHIFVPGDFIIHSGTAKVGKGDDDTYATKVVKVIEVTEEHLVVDDVISGRHLIVSRDIWPDFRLATEAMIEATFTQIAQQEKAETKLWLPTEDISQP